MRRFGMSVTCYIKLTDTDSCNISKFGKCYKKLTVADSCNILRIVALCDQKRFGKHYFMSSTNLLRIVVNKSHLARRASHYVLYPKFLVNYPFVPLTAFLGSRIITHSRNHIYEYSHVCICKRIQEIIYVNIRMCAYVPLQWKMTPHQWKLRA